MLIANIFKSESKQGFKVFYFGSGEAVAISSGIRCVSNKSPRADIMKINKGCGIEIQNPIYESSKNERESSLYNRSPEIKSRNNTTECSQPLKVNITNRDDALKGVKEIIERVNTGIEIIPDIRIFAQDILDAKSEIEKLEGGSGSNISLPQPPVECDGRTPGSSRRISADYLYELKDSIDEFCNKLTYLCSEQS